MRKFCIYNIISLLALCFTTTAFAQSYSLTIAGISVNDANCNDVFNDGGSVSYSPSTKTLTFNNFSASNFSEFYINSFDAVRTIRLKGNNVLICENGWGIGLDVTCGEEVTICGDTPNDKMECGDIHLGLVWTQIGFSPPSHDVHFRFKNCSVKINSTEGFIGKDGRLTIENANLTVKSKNGGISRWKELKLGTEVSFIQPDGAYFSKALGAVTVDGKEPYKGGRISIGNTNSQYFQNAYVLYQKDGHVTSISFSEKPVISYSGDELVVTTSTVTVQYPLDFLNKISVEGHVEEVTSIDEVILPNTEFSFSDEGAKVRGEKPGTPFYVFDAQGTKCTEGVIDAEGKANIQLSNLPKGIYVVKTQSTSFKVKK